MQARPIHEALQPLLWLVGKWKSVSANGQYPTIKTFDYCEEIEFESLGQPILNYSAKTWHPIQNNVMHLESGFLRIKPGSNELAFLVAHNFGVTTLEEGCVEGTCINLKTKDISRISFAKDPAVTELTREYKYCSDKKKLQFVLFMATNKTPLTEHLRVTYEKIN